MVKTYVKRMVLDSCVMFNDVRLTHVLRTVDVCCTFCCIQCTFLLCSPFENKYVYFYVLYVIGPSLCHNQTDLAT